MTPNQQPSETRAISFSSTSPSRCRLSVPARVRSRVPPVTAVDRLGDPLEVIGDGEIELTLMKIDIELVFTDIDTDVNGLL